MLLRPRQDLFVARCLDALETHGNTLGVAPTGSGKTVMLSAIGGRHGGRVLILQHRDELVEQNQRTYVKVNPRAATARYTAASKQWGPDATFAMVPTLHRVADRLPPFDLVIADEAHHARAASWGKILDAAREANPNVRILGVTATPNRSDRRGLGDVFNNCADRITLGELIAEGHLVPPRAFVLADEHLGAQLDGAKLKSGEYDLDAVAEIMMPETASVVAKWKELASDRRTIVFCATKAHALQVTQAFGDAGVRATCVLGDTPADERRARIRAFDRGDFRVLVNVAVATEGFDCQPVSCVILLRPESFQSTLIQMVGRGLRTVDADRYPGVLKTDCIVLDFGRSLLKYGTIEQALDLEGKKPGAAPMKLCLECHNGIPSTCKQCPLCGAPCPVEAPKKAEKTEEPRAEQMQLEVNDLKMMEIDILLGASPFRWWQINERAMVACAFEVFAVAFLQGGVWHSFGGRDSDGYVHRLALGTQQTAVAHAEDYLRNCGDQAAAHKSRSWMAEPATPKQLAYLGRLGAPRATTRYEAQCRITLAKAKPLIERILGLRARPDAGLEEVTA